MNSSTLRPREKIQQRTQVALTDHELLQAIIGSGTQKKNVRHIARELLKLLRRSNSAVSYDAVRAIEGMGPAKSALIVAAFELSRRYAQSTAHVSAVGKPEHGGLYCRFYSGGTMLVEERWYPASFVMKSFNLVREIMTVALRSAAAHCVIYDGYNVDESMGRLEALQRRHLFIDAGQTIGFTISKYVLVHHNSMSEEV